MNLNNCELLVLKFILSDSVLFAPWSFIAHLNFLCVCARANLILLFWSQRNLTLLFWSQKQIIWARGVVLA